VKLGQRVIEHREKSALFAIDRISNLIDVKRLVLSPPQGARIGFYVTFGQRRLVKDNIGLFRRDINEKVDNFPQLGQRNGFGFRKVPFSNAIRYLPVHRGNANVRAVNNAQIRVKAVVVDPRIGINGVIENRLGVSDIFAACRLAVAARAKSVDSLRIQAFDIGAPARVLGP
jgi:hypothetical protein